MKLCSIYLLIFDCIIYFLLLSCKNSLYILDTNILLDTYTANIFS